MGILAGHLSDFLAWWTTARLSVLIAGVGVPFLAWQVRSTARDSRARSRPIVTAVLRRAPYTHSYALDVTNSGASAARGLVVTFDPPLPDDPMAPGGQRSVIPFMAARYATPIAVLPPAATLSNVYYVGRADPSNPAGRIVNVEPTPDQVSVALRYQDDDGHRYRDVFPLDVDVLLKETETTSSSSPQKQQEKALKEFTTLVGHARAAAATLDEVADFGLRYRTRHADRRRDADEAKQDAALERMGARLTGQPPPEESRTASRRRRAAEFFRRLAARVDA